MNILFLCTGNSCRSQMAEGWLRHLHPQIGSFSAGVEQQGVNPLAVRVMADVGIDISQQESKAIDSLPRVFFDCVITLCDHAATNCPLMPGAGQILHHPFPDPPRLASCLDDQDEVLAVYRSVRDSIGDFIRTLPDTLEPKGDS